jgi:hypothetical protein
MNELYNYDGLLEITSKEQQRIEEADRIIAEALAARDKVEISEAEARHERELLEGLTEKELLTFYNGLEEHWADFIGLSEEEWKLVSEEEKDRIFNFLSCGHLMERLYTRKQVDDLLINRYKLKVNHIPMLRERIINGAEPEPGYDYSEDYIKVGLTPPVSIATAKNELLSNPESTDLVQTPTTAGAISGPRARNTNEIIKLNSRDDATKYLIDKNIFRVKSGDTLAVVIEDGWEVDIKTFSRLYAHIGYNESAGNGNIKFKSIVNDFLNYPDCNENPVLNIDCRFELPYGRNGKIFNTFKGFKVKPINHGKDISLIYNHIKEVICSGNEIWNEYVVSWIADMFQSSFDKKGTAIGIRGKQGCGKSIIFDDLIIQRILGTEYGLHTENDPFDGNFNGILKGKLLVNMDEGSWDTSRKTAGKIKSCITGMTEIINEKNKPERTYTNYKRFIFTTNEEWIVKVEDGDRRYFILECSDKKVKDFAYFNALWAVIEDKECQEQFLYDMMNYNIKINLRDIPMTEAKELQIKYSMAFIEKYIDSISESPNNLPYNPLNPDSNKYLVIDSEIEGKIEYRIPCNDLLKDYNGKYHQNMIQDVFNRRLKSRGIEAQRKTTNGIKTRVVSIFYDIEEED